MRDAHARQGIRQPVQWIHGGGAAPATAAFASETAESGPTGNDGATRTRPMSAQVNALVRKVGTYRFMNGASIQPYAAIGVTLLMVVALAGGMLVVAHVLGPKRRGPVKDSPYESGMPIIVGTERRFHIRFYLVAVLFLLFDVEVVFLWPWAMAFYQAAVHGTTIPMEPGLTAGKGFLLGGMGFFFALLLFGLVYEWKRGALEWD